MAQVIYLRRAIPCAMAQALTTMELVPVPLVPTCDKKWVYKAVKISIVNFIHFQVKTFSPVEKKMEFPSQVVSKSILFCFQPNSNRFRTCSGAVHHVMACVVKRATPPIWRVKLCEFQHGKSILESGINNIGGFRFTLRDQILGRNGYELH